MNANPFFNIPRVNEVTKQTPCGTYLITRDAEPNAVQIMRVCNSLDGANRLTHRELRKIQEQGFVLRSEDYLDVDSNPVLIDKTYYSAIFDHVR